MNNVISQKSNKFQKVVKGKSIDGDGGGKREKEKGDRKVEPDKRKENSPEAPGKRFCSRMMCCCTVMMEELVEGIIRRIEINI